MKTEMHQGAYGDLFSRARNLRNHLTTAEQILWEELRGKQVGVKFRRQHPILKYIVDFYCYQLKIVIEVDGDSHDGHIRQLEDYERDSNLRMLEYHVIRFSNDQVINHTVDVMSIITTFVNCLLRYRNTQSDPPSPL